MPTIPMFDQSAAAGAWHNVIAPGGYECWAFDAEDAATDTQVSVLFMSGAQLSAPYLRHVSRYRQDPTRTPLPLPTDYGGVAVSLYRGGKRVHRSFTPAKLVASTDQITLGRNRLMVSSESHRLQIEVDGAKVDLTATRAADGPTRRVLKFMRLSLHHSTLISPRASFTGTINGQPFAGVGTHDYAFGTGPISYSLSRLIRGRIITADATAVFYLARHQAEKLQQEAALLHVGPAGVVESDQATISQPYADEIRFGDHLVLTAPRIIDAGDYSQRIIFDAQLHGMRATAHCDVLYPQPPQPTKAAAVLAWLD
jgi:hypothetical protein